jgi:hypothetical protein
MTISPAVKHTLSLAALCVFVFVATVTVIHAAQNGTLAGGSMANDINSHFGQIVRDRQAAGYPATTTTP